jgi:hypothetical protein
MRNELLPQHRGMATIARTTAVADELLCNEIATDRLTKSDTARGAHARCTAPTVLAQTEQALRADDVTIYALHDNKGAGWVSCFMSA